MKKNLILVLICILTNQIFAQKKQAKTPFYWGVATAAYQVDGNYKVDGKGESKWDFLTNTVGITQFTIKEKQTGNIAINMYNRAQYLKDIELMKQLGVNSYRMSLDWSRIIPDGTGEPNEIALAHYDVLFDDLLKAGIEPFVTIYHFDFPNVLLQKGGWGNPEMGNWYLKYAKLVVDRYGKKIKHFISFNEPYIEFFLVENMLNSDPSKPMSKEFYLSQMQKLHNQLLANARIIEYYHAKKFNGKIGLAINVNPGVAWNPKNLSDIKAAKFQDLLINGLILDPIYKGKYPKLVMDTLAIYNPSFKPSKEELSIILKNKPDFLGVNYYAPAIVKGEDSPISLKWLDNNPDSIKSNVGPVRPQYLYEMLMRLKNNYGNPLVYITENGTGFVQEDIKINGKINDPMRANFIRKHVEAALKARKQGANLQGYIVWSGWDNFEWVSGYTKRLGLIYVDFETQERTPKQSFYEYQRIIKTNRKL